MAFADVQLAWQGIVVCVILGIRWVIEGAEGEGRRGESMRHGLLFSRRHSGKLSARPRRQLEAPVTWS